MTDSDPEIEFEPEDSSPEEPIHGPDGSLDCTNGRYNFVLAWLSKLGVSEAELDGSALIFGEGCSVAIIHPFTGEVLTPMEIAKKAGVGAPRRVQ